MSALLLLNIDVLVEMIKRSLRRNSQLLAENIIEHCYSPWWAQLVIANDLNNKQNKGLSVDYSQTVNLYTQLDAYPMPRIDMINSLARYKVFSTFNLKSAYHQIPIIESKVLLHLRPMGSDASFVGCPLV